MNNRYRQLKKYIITLKIKKFLITYFNTFLFLLIYASATVALMGLAAGIFSVPVMSIKYIVLTALIPGVLKVLSDILKYRRNSVLALISISREIAESCEEIQDRIVNTVSLYKQRSLYSSPVAREIIRRLMEDTLKKIDALPRGVISLKSVVIRSIIIAALLLISFAAAGRYSFYREGLNLVKASFLWDRDYYIEVLPGDIVSPPGYDVDINIKTNMVRPELEIMVMDEKYRRQPAKAGPQ
ncbi:MAG: hypothetical protein U9R36_01245, partial [Elusimicrobiota bacterium]|nr:hypothetical protein [Elusimicrobiota bacterium]